MHHSTFIGQLASIYKPAIYVELGLYEGETLQKVQPFAQKLYGVDIKSNEHLECLKNMPNITISYELTDKFFESFDKKIDMAFIDADHNYNSVVKDFENVFSRLTQNGIILLHDTDPDNDRLIHPNYCGDSYRIVHEFERRDDINIVTFPIAEAGLSIITKKSSTRTNIRHSITSLISPS
jgi:predicted O-methyltransferase YrrM